MALSTTVLNDAIAQLAANNTFNAYENRLDSYAAYKYHEDNAAGLLPADVIENIKKSARQPVKVPVLNKTSNPYISTRSCNISVPTGTSEFYTLTWGTLGFTAGISKAFHEDNYITAEAFLADQIKSGVISVMGQLETLAVASLDTGKTTNFASTVYTNDGSSYLVPQADKADFYKNIPAVMRRQVLDAPVYDDIANTEAATLQTFLDAQGAANATNTQYQFSNQRYNFYRTNGITAGVGEDEVHYLAAPGAAGVYGWIDIDSRMNNEINAGQFMDVMTDPVMGMEWGVYYKRDCADESARLSGLERTLTEAWEFSKDFAFVTARNSADDTPIVKFVIQS